MRVLIVSDIHGNFDNMRKVIENNPSFDKLLLLGDILVGPNTYGYNPEQLALFLNIYKDKIIAVKGNNDWDSHLLEFPVDKNYILFPIDGKLCLLTHGHIYNRSNLPNIDFDVFIQGHSHVPRMDKVDNKLYLNPGSITLPRGGSDKTYILYEDGMFFLKTLDNKILKKFKG